MWSAAGTGDRSVSRGVELQSQRCTLCLGFPALVSVKSSPTGVYCVGLVPGYYTNVLLMISFCFCLDASLELMPVLLRMSMAQAMSPKRSVGVPTGRGPYWNFSPEKSLPALSPALAHGQVCPEVGCRPTAPPGKGPRQKHLGDPFGHLRQMHQAWPGVVSCLQNPNPVQVKNNHLRLCLEPHEELATVCTAAGGGGVSLFHLLSV